MRVPQPIVWGVLTFFIGLAILFLGTFWYEIKNEVDIKTDVGSERKEENILKEIPVETHPGGDMNTMAPDSVIENLPIIRYKNGYFSPLETIIKKGGYGVECFLNIINESDHTLLLRLGPHEAGKEKGFLYNSIASGESGIIDPRYVGIADPVFYNLANPSETLRVHMDRSCE